MCSFPCPPVCLLCRTGDHTTANKLAERLKPDDQREKDQHKLQDEAMKPL